MRISESEEFVIDRKLDMSFARGQFEEVSSVQDVDVCLIATTEEEEDTLVREVFSSEDASHRPYPPSYRRIYSTRHRYKQRNFSVIGCRSSDQGSMNVLASLTDVFSHFRPRIVAMIGIAGGLDEKINLGDVVVAKTTYWYERAKISDGKTSRQLRAFQLPEKTVNLVDSILGDMRRSRNFPSTKFESYGTGEKVVADQLSEVREYLNTIDRKVAAVEMESGGFFQYFDSPSFRADSEAWIVVKGISDHADKNKGDSQQELASRNSLRVGLPLACDLLIELDRS